MSSHLSGHSQRAMTLDTFKSKVSSYWKLEMLQGALFMMLMGAAAVPTLFVVRRLDRVGFDATATAIVSISYMFTAVLMFYVLCPLRQKHLRKLQGGCPACGRLLLGKHAKSVIATGRCPACGNQVVQ